MVSEERKFIPMTLQLAGLPWSWRFARVFLGPDGLTDQKNIR